MDDIVKQAMAKWPNVPHCHGWLALDARGNWRMRDDRAQAEGLPGDKIVNAALLGFINRNYACDDQGRWYFQNGPQRVYVDLEALPYIARTDPALGFILQTNQPLSTIDAAWMTETGRLLLQGDARIALVDDRDMAQCIARMWMDGAAVSDDKLLAWLDDSQGSGGDLRFRNEQLELPLQRIREDEIPARFHFVRRPRADPA
ncbi:MAG: DUF2946 family protein [Pseudomonadota bacterium]